MPSRRPGRPTVSPKAGEKVSVNLRIPSELKRRLTEASELSERNLSQEVEYRLTRSFDRADILSEAISLAYGPKVGGLLMLLGQTALVVGRGAGSQHSVDLSQDFFDDPQVYEEMRWAMETVLAATAPNASDELPQDVAVAWRAKTALLIDLMAAALGYDGNLNEEGAAWKRRIMALLGENRYRELVANLKASISNAR